MPSGEFVKNTVVHSVRFIEVWTLKVRSGSPAKWNRKPSLGKRAKFVRTGRLTGPPVCAEAGRDHTIDRTRPTIKRSDVRFFIRREYNHPLGPQKWAHHPITSSILLGF